MGRGQVPDALDLGLQGGGIELPLAHPLAENRRFGGANQVDSDGPDGAHDRGRPGLPPHWLAAMKSSRQTASTPSCRQPFRMSVKLRSAATVEPPLRITIKAVSTAISIGRTSPPTLQGPCYFSAGGAAPGQTRNPKSGTPCSGWRCPAGQGATYHGSRTRQKESALPLPQPPHNSDRAQSSVKNPRVPCWIRRSWFASGRSGVPEADRLAVGGIHGEVLIERRPAVVAVERQIRLGLILQPAEGGGRMHQRRAPIAPDDHIGPQPRLTGPHRR